MKQLPIVAMVVLILIGMSLQTCSGEPDDGEAGQPGAPSMGDGTRETEEEKQTIKAREEYRLQVVVDGEEVRSFGLVDLQGLPQVEIAVN